jgi:hypothetical protein
MKNQKTNWTSDKMCKNDLPECPAVRQCVSGNSYPACIECLSRTRRADGLFECCSYEEKKLVTLATASDPTIELFES